ncbi:CDP-alcohol phosphatidyltransferase family protein [Spirosoma aureum]|uniref:CDP-alcohol phosphatidyltransferase family protein n=1 Tax=Spirosoma aureum TaxID=2692134 RepID=UPI003742C23C
MYLAYRLVASPFLFLLDLTENLDGFKWVFPSSFLSDALDGYFARKYKVIRYWGNGWTPLPIS